MIIIIKRKALFTEESSVYNVVYSVCPTQSHGNSYIFYEVANSYDLTRTIYYDLSKPQWWLGLGAGLGVGHSYKFIRFHNS